jgi:hypothetical protein
MREALVSEELWEVIRPLLPAEVATPTLQALL